MTTITVSGASDDLVEIEGCHGADEFTLPTDDIWRGDLIASTGEQMRLHLIYDGCWHVAIGQVHEDVPLPPWPLTFEQGNRMDGTPGYSVVLTIDAPDGTRLTNTRSAA